VGKNRLRRIRSEEGQVVVLLAIVLAILAAGLWVLLSSRTARENEARAFAREATDRLLFRHDAHFLNQHLSPRVQALYPPSWRERFFGWVGELGAIEPQIDVSGRVTFTSEFFQPRGHFEAHVQAANGPAILEMYCSQSAVQWQIDALNLTWTPPPTPTASPTFVTPLFAPAPADSPPPPPPPKPTRAPRK
jgi:hypothetical protein